MCRADTHRKRTFDLRSQLNLNIFGIDALIFFPVVMEVSVFIDETRHFVGGSYRTPAVINPLTGHGEVQPKVCVRMRFRIVSDFREPRAGHHEAGRVNRYSSQRLDACGSDGSSFTK